MIEPYTKMSDIDEIDSIPKTNIWRVDKRRRRAVPLLSGRASAGFGNPAELFMEKRLNLNDLCVSHSNASYFVKVEGESMIGANIFPGSILVVDATIPERDGCILVCYVNDDLLVKRYVKSDPIITLFPQNDNYLPIYVHKEVDYFQVIGVVTFIVNPPPKWDFDNLQKARQHAQTYAKSYVRAG